MFEDLYFNKKCKAAIAAAAVLLLIPVSSSEQAGAVIIALLICAIIYQLIEKSYKGTLPFLIGILILYLVVFLSCTIFCPGNTIRAAKETEVWLPDFYTIDIKKHLIYAYRYVINAFVNQMGALPLALILTEAFCLLLNKERKSIDFAVAVFLFSAAAALLFRNRFPQITDLRAEWGIEAFSLLNRYVLILWSFVMLILLVVPFRVFGNVPIGWMMFLLIGAAYAAIAVMCFSPTMYASNYRTKYVSSIILTIVVLAFAVKVMKKSSVAGCTLLTIMDLLALCNYFVLMS